MIQKNLFFNHQLNYNEVIRRLLYWTTDDSDGALSAIRILAKLLEREKNNLYFEVAPTESEDA